MSLLPQLVLFDPDPERAPSIAQRLALQEVTGVVGGGPQATSAADLDALY